MARIRNITSTRWAVRIDPELWCDVEFAAAKHGEIGNGRSRVSGTHSTQSGRDADSYVARLKRDDPDMAEQVVNGELTANAAARQKGWRKPRISVTSPHSVASRLRQHFTDDEWAEFRKLINDFDTEEGAEH